MDRLTAIVSGIAGNIVEYTIEPVGGQMSYLVHHKSNLQNLESQVDNLGAARERVQHTVIEVKRKGKTVDIDVEKWLTRVDQITGEANKFLKDESQAKTQCLHGLCPTLIRRYQLSKKSRKLVQVVLQLHANTEFPRFSYNAPHKRCGAYPQKRIKDFNCEENRGGTKKS
ncbi:disease resistance protein [Prunus yedoensis var. nudiflora]|uniref:Disease resistance protein n=1 Tax=Prunus yedoensis var. nudiflora TaxID=2094558 RepID=A0A314YJH5_PRUYE|nr:disease resistance protein [Prunus yedoensis var. nudiflora]